MSNDNQKCCEELWDDFLEGKVYIHVPLIFILIAMTFYIN